MGVEVAVQFSECNRPSLTLQVACKGLCVLSWRQSWGIQSTPCPLLQLRQGLVSACRFAEFVKIPVT